MHIIKEMWLYCNTSTWSNIQTYPGTCFVAATMHNDGRKYEMVSKESTSSVIMETTMRSVFMCLTLCDSTPSCVNINYYMPHESCQLLGIPQASDVYVTAKVR